MKLKTTLNQFLHKNKSLLKIASEESGMQTETLLPHILIMCTKKNLLAK